MIQVLPVAEGGVADFARCLRAEWSGLGVASCFVPFSAELAAERSLALRVAEALATRGANETVAVVLHFSGYGFSKRGACLWLLKELDALRRAHRHRVRLVAVFHELFASGPPWRSAFWLSSTQAAIAARIARIADALWTNTNAHADWLRGVADPRIPLVVRPVFSNIGESVAPAPALSRAPSAVVFGLSSTRQRAFDGLRGREAALKRLGVRELVEVGDGGQSRSSVGMDHRYLGRLEADALRGLLVRSRFGVINYASSGLAKSGVFAGYAASGCTVINTKDAGTEADGLTRGREYLDLRSSFSGDEAAHADSVAASLVRWYSRHRLRAQAGELLELALGNASGRTGRPACEGTVQFTTS